MQPQKNWKQRSSCCNSRGTTSCSSPSTTHFFNSATVTRPSPSVSTTRKAKSASCGVSSGAPVCQRGEDMMDMIIDSLIWLISFISLHWFHCLGSSQATTWKDLQNLQVQSKQYVPWTVAKRSSAPRINSWVPISPLWSKSKTRKRAGTTIEVSLVEKIKLWSHVRLWSHEPWSHMTSNSLKSLPTKVLSDSSSTDLFRGLHILAVEFQGQVNLQRRVLSFGSKDEVQGK